MTPTLAIRVPGTPVAQPRSRAVIRGQHAGIYTPTTADGWKGNVAAMAHKAAVESGWKQPDRRTPLRIDIDFFWHRPSGFRKTEAFKVTKPDRDNCDKAVLDALVLAAVIADDAQVVGGEIWKRIDDDWQGAVIVITVLEQPAPLAKRKQKAPQLALIGEGSPP